MWYKKKPKMKCERGNEAMNVQSKKEDDGSIEGEREGPIGGELVPAVKRKAREAESASTLKEPKKICQRGKEAENAHSKNEGEQARKEVVSDVAVTATAAGDNPPPTEMSPLEQAQIRAAVAAVVAAMAVVASNQYALAAAAAAAGNSPPSCPSKKEEQEMKKTEEQARKEAEQERRDSEEQARKEEEEEEEEEEEGFF